MRLCHSNSFSQFIINIRHKTETSLRGLTLTETVSDAVVVSSKPVSITEKIVEGKTIVYETRTDSTVIKLAAEKVKDKLFTRFGLLKPKPEDVQFVSIDKYYEPYVMIAGRYLVDYYRKCLHPVEIDKEVLEVILLERTFVPEPPEGSSAEDYKTIRLEGEERLKNEVKASLILDRFGQEVSLENLPSAPSEENPDKILEEFGVEEVAENMDVSIMRNKIVKHPTDVKRLVCEIFEVNERAIIYTPRFKVTLSNLKTGKEKTLEFDGVTAQRIAQTKHAETRNTLFNPPPPPP